MYKLIEYCPIYFNATGSLWFYSKDEAADVNADIATIDVFKSFKHKAKLLGNTQVDETNKILRNAAIPVSLKYLSNFWRSLKMSLINCKVELKLRWTKHCVLAANKNNNANANSNDINYTIKESKLYVPVVTLSAKDNQKLSKPLSKIFERFVYWNEYKTKIENKDTTNECKYFVKSNFVRVN